MATASVTLPVRFFLLLMVVAFLPACAHVRVQNMKLDLERALGSEWHGETLDFTLLSFKQKDPGEKFPLLFAIHGLGDSGASYLEIWEEAAVDHRVMIVAPTRIRAFRHQEKDLLELQALVDVISNLYPVDSRRLWLAGVSSGTLVARSLMVKNPLKWTAVVFIATVQRRDWIKTVDEKLKFPPILYVHGHRDPQMPFEEIQAQVEILKRRGDTVGLMDFEDAAHEHRSEWNQGIFEWLEKQPRREV